MQPVLKDCVSARPQLLLFSDDADQAAATCLQ